MVRVGVEAPEQVLPAAKLREGAFMLPLISMPMIDRWSVRRSACLEALVRCLPSDEAGTDKVRFLAGMVDAVRRTSKRNLKQQTATDSETQFGGANGVQLPKLTS